jgi:hypothetical protein
MATKTISLELDAYERLRRAKREGESFSGVVRRAHFGPCDATGASILATLKEAPPKRADRDAATYWDKEENQTRSISPSPWETEA